MLPGRTDDTQHQEIHMLKKLPRLLKGCIAFALHTFNVLFWASSLLVIAFFRAFVPFKSWRYRIKQWMYKFPIYWSDINNWIINLFTDIEYQIDEHNYLSPKEFYLMIANHRSWTDIIILMQVFKRKIPILKFFMKKQLIWTLPLGGLAAYVLDYPFMERHNKTYLKKHPEKRGKDIETTRKFCEKFKNIPTTFFSFVEGTRFTQQKHDNQNSPYQYLLKPKAGGVSFILGVMGQNLHYILDVTLIYPKNYDTLWQYCCGDIKKIKIKINRYPVTLDLIGNYEIDNEHRVHMQRWLNGL